MIIQIYMTKTNFKSAERILKGKNHHGYEDKAASLALFQTKHEV